MSCAGSVSAAAAGMTKWPVAAISWQIGQFAGSSLEGYLSGVEWELAFCAFAESVWASAAEENGPAAKWICVWVMKLCWANAISASQATIMRQPPGYFPTWLRETAFMPRARCSAGSTLTNKAPARHPPLTGVAVPSGSSRKCDLPAQRRFQLPARGLAVLSSERAGNDDAGQDRRRIRR